MGYSADDAAFGLHALIRCAEREVRRRMRVYPVRINSRRMTPETAAWEIKAMAAIAGRLREAAEREAELERLL